MFVRKLTVILVPLGMVLLLCLATPLLAALGAFWGSLVLGLLLGILLGLLLPLAGATRLREPFAWLLWIPAAILLLVLLYQYLATLGVSVPLLRLLAVNDSRIITLESAFAAYMLTFSVRTGRGI
ncbi:MAG: hypothetical protein IJG94_09555 [Clostridia bacterium]|jgi:hypothetical protein|nr:hypothetical protein [Clostridia bacterium]